jgi:hypothetical protein
VLVHLVFTTKKIRLILPINIAENIIKWAIQTFITVVLHLIRIITITRKLVSSKQDTWILLIIIIIIASVIRKRFVHLIFIVC